MAKMSDEERNRRDRDRRFRRKYGISLEEYERMHEEQGGVCAICQQPQSRPRKKPGKAHRPPAPRLATDHDHETGVVRGLLCSNCNHKLIGRWKDPVVLRAAADYLERGNARAVQERAQQSREGIPPAEVVPVDIPPSNETPVTIEVGPRGQERIVPLEPPPT